jgi:hypothetical protein
MRLSPVRPALAIATAGALAVLAACGGTTPPSSSQSSPAGQTSSPSTPSPSTQTTTAALPAGYQSVTSAAQHLTLAVPASWVVLDLSKLSITAALRRFSLGSVPSKTMTADIETLAKKKALFVADLGSASKSPHQFTTNANAFCESTPLLPGTGAASELDSGFRSEWESIGVTLLSLKNTTVNSNEVVVTMELRAPTSAGYALTEVQVDTLTAQGKLCYLTMTTDQPSAFLSTFRTIASTLRVS